MKVQGHNGTEVVVNLAASTMDHIVLTSGIGEVTTHGQKCKVTHTQGTEFYVDGMRVPTGHYWQNGKVRPVMGKPKAKRKRKQV